MSAFVSEKLVKVEISENEYIEIKEELSFDDVTDITDMKSFSEGEQTKKLMFMFIQNWNLKDGENPVEVSDENILRLGTDAFVKVMEEVKKIVSKMKEKEGFTAEQVSEKKN